MEDNEKIFHFPFQRGELLLELNRFEALKKFRQQYQLISRMIMEVEDAMLTWQTPKNPREDLVQIHDKKSLQIWKRQKERLEQKIAILEQEIQQSIHNSKSK